MDDLRYIAGAGGGGGKGGGGDQHTPTEAPDTLRSRQYARIIDAICEGEIEGLVDGLKSVYLNGTPIQNPDGSANFSGVVLATRPGTQTQESIPGFPDSESEIAAGEEVKSSHAIVHTITNPNVDAARVTLQFPQLSDLDVSTGDLNGTQVQIRIELQSNGGGYQPINFRTPAPPPTPVVTKTGALVFMTEATLAILQGQNPLAGSDPVDIINGKCTTPYFRSYRVGLVGSPPWDIRVTKITPDSTRSSLSNSVFWSSYTEIIDDGLAYPNTALCGLQIDAQQFTSVPVRGYDCKLLRVQVPVNYDPITRVYTGTWDGSWKIAWTDNPAWCFRDLVLSPRYGIGAFVADLQLNKWLLYSIAQYADELVDDGKGGTEPRFTCNLYLQTAAEAYSVLNNFASIFRGILYWSGGMLAPVADQPIDPAFQFNQTNVVDGAFIYQGSSRRSRHTVALIAWNDPSDFYKQKLEYVEDTDGIARYGIQKTQIVAFGCASRGQAHRLGRWLLLTERLETETVSFRAGIEGTYAYPGAVIQIHDPNRVGTRMGGRIVAATSNSITVDAPVTLAIGHVYTLTCQMPDGTLSTKAVTNPGTGTPQTVLSMSQAFASAPNVQSVWILQADNLVPTRWRVLSVRESSATEYEITALQNDESKYDAAEGGIVLTSPPTSYLPQQNAPPPPTVLTWSDVVITIGPNLEHRLEIGWTAPAAAPGEVAGYVVEWQYESGLLYRSAQIVETSYQVPAQPGLYLARVWAVGRNGLLSNVLVGSHQVANTSPLATARVTGLELFGQDQDTLFRGLDASFAWRYNASATSYDMGSEPQGGDSGSLDPTFKDFEVRVYDVVTGLLVRQPDHTTDPEWTYTYAENLHDGHGVARRTFKIGVSIRDKYNARSEEATLTVSNPLSPPPTDISVLAGPGLLFLAFTHEDAADWRNVLIWAETTANFTPSDENLRWRGASSPATLTGLAPNTLYHLRVASEDAFGVGDLGPIEYTGTPAASTATGADIVKAVNTQISGATDTNKLIVTKDAFAVQDPQNAQHYPFAVAQLLDGTWAIVLDANVVIGGNLIIDQLRTGSLPNDVRMSLGGGVIVLDGAGSISVFKGLGAQQDYVLLTAGDIVFRKWITALAGYVTYNHLRRLETGTANSGDTVAIPGYWEQQPIVQVSPNLVQLFDPTKVAQSQSLRCQAQNLQETVPGSKQWQFVARATLELGTNSGQTTINVNSGDTAAVNYTSAIYTTQTNTTDVTVHVKVRSKRGNGASQYFRRQYRWRVDYKLHSAGTWTTPALSAWLDIGDVIDTDVLATLNSTFGGGGANQWDFRAYVEWQDKDGTLFGAISYQTPSAETIALAAGPVNASIQDGNPWVGPSPESNTSPNITLAASTLNPSWEIYEIDWTYQWSWQDEDDGATALDRTTKLMQIVNGAAVLQQVLHSINGSYGRTLAAGYILGNIGSYAQVTNQVVSGSFLTYTNSMHAFAQITKSGISQFSRAQASVRNVSAIIKRRTPAINSAIAVNSVLVDFYDWDLAGASVLAPGSLNYIAVGR